MTIIVPCYNEAARLPVDTFRQYVAEADADTRFLFVNDGSKDATLDLLRSLAATAPQRMFVHDLPANAGKAEAVRQGFLAALNGAAGEPRPSVVGFWDADLATPLDCIPLLGRVLEDHPHVEMVLGSRVLMMGRDIQRKPLRHYCGRVFATFASMTLKLPVYDTQCGAKLFRVNDTFEQIIAEPFLSRWIFDVELIARWLQLRRGTDTVQANQAIYECPLPRWVDVAGSKVRTRDFFKAAGELWGIRRRYLRG